MTIETIETRNFLRLTKEVLILIWPYYLFPKSYVRGYSALNNAY